MIVKVQISLMTTHEKPQALIYNKDRSVFLEEAASEDLLRTMAGEARTFFRARITKNKKLELLEPVGEQDW